KTVDAEEGRDRDVGRSDVPAHVPRIGRSKEHLAIVGGKPKLQSAVDAAGLDVGLPDFSPRGGIEPEQPAVLVAADHDVAPFPSPEVGVPDELGLLAES